MHITKQDKQLALIKDICRADISDFTARKLIDKIVTDETRNVINATESFYVRANELEQRINRFQSSNYN